MEMKNNTRREQALAIQANSATAFPFKILDYLFASVIDVLINIPVMNAVWRERRELELLTNEHIKDIGLNPDAVRLEIKRSFFDIPLERKRSWKNTAQVECCKTF